MQLAASQKSRLYLIMPLDWDSYSDSPFFSALFASNNWIWGTRIRGKIDLFLVLTFYIFDSLKFVYVCYSIPFKIYTKLFSV